MKKEERGLIDAAMIWHAVQVIDGVSLSRSDKMLARACLKLLRGPGWGVPRKRTKTTRGAK